MDYNSTHLNSILFIYGELNDDEESSHLDVLLTDNVAFDEFEEIDSTYQLLNSINSKPKKQTIDNIMEYSKRSASENVD
ncbi:MAG: hypothetical protein P8P48_11765 [Saprospiraceae bacterium]|nr:hypothetical protein [Saprospiraceae bacterium]